MVRANTVFASAISESSRSLLLHGGEGEVEDMDGNVFPIRKGDMYVLDKHFLRGERDKDMILVSIFNPPLTRTERHKLDDPAGSTY